jgi:RNA polymerase sigma factor (sigma-70 family)
VRSDADPGAWDGVDALPEYLRRVLAPRCRDAFELEDVVQEACVRAARYRRTLADEARLRPWAARIALNVLKSRARRLQDARQRPLEEGEEHACPAPEPEAVLDSFRAGPWLVDREEALRHLRFSFAGLRDDDRRLLSAFYGGGESCRQAARVCELSPGLAKVRLFRARQRLLRLFRRRVSLSSLRWIDVEGRVHDLARRDRRTVGGAR